MKTAVLIAKFFLILVILIWYPLLLAQKIDLSTADLGRHLKNGEVILSEGLKSPVLFTNFYSYTQNDYPFVNHHWGSGVIFYLIYHFYGFVGLSIFYVGLGAVTLLLFCYIAQKDGHPFSALLFTLMLMPLLAFRVEIRPEMFTYFLSGVVYFLLWQWRKGRLTNKALLWLPVLMFLWVNLHIGFIFGFLIIAAFGLDQLIRLLSKRSNGFVFLAITAVASVASALLNPWGVKGLWYPLEIFKNYGYLIVENQSIPFLENLGFATTMPFGFFKLVLVIVAVSFVFAFVVNRNQFFWTNLVLTVVTGFLAFLGIRHFPSFAFFALPTLSLNFYRPLPGNMHRAYRLALTLVFIVALGIVGFRSYSLFTAKIQNFGLGLAPKVSEAAEFFRQNGIAGPVFNNYDVGGYLIFYLFPKEKVFVDNRPEAYSTAFFENVYKPVQQDEQKWQKLDGEYNFNAIFFSHRDYTPWGQQFLITRIQDAGWAPVFADSYNIIFLKRKETNMELIKKYEIPKERFSIIKN